MRGKHFVTCLVLLAFGFLLFSCSSQMDEEDLLAHVKEIHEKVLTVDTHADTPSRLLREGWNIGERHDPEERSSGCMSENQIGVIDFGFGGVCCNSDTCAGRSVNTSNY